METAALHLREVWAEMSEANNWNSNVLLPASSPSQPKMCVRLRWAHSCLTQTRLPALLVSEGNLCFLPCLPTNWEGVRPSVTRKDVWVGSSLAKEELKRCSLPRLEYWRKFLTGGSHSGVSVCVIGRAGKDTTHSIPSLTPSFQSELRIYHLQSTSPRICSSDWRNNEKATDTQKEATVFCYSGVLPAKDSHWGTFSWIFWSWIWG